MKNVYHLNNFQLVEINDVLLNYDHPIVQNEYLKLVRMKYESYKWKHDLNFLPLDAFDFVGTHVFVIDKFTKQPLLCWRGVTYSKCQEYNRDFIALSFAKGCDNSQQHQEALESIVEECCKKKEDIVFWGALAVSSAVESHDTLRKLFEIFQATAVYYCESYAINRAIISATIMFQTDCTFKKMGFRPLTLDGISLPFLKVKQYNDLEAQLFYFDGRFSQSTLAFAQRYRSLWENRLTTEVGIDQKKKAA